MIKLQLIALLITLLGFISPSRDALSHGVFEYPPGSGGFWVRSYFVDSLLDPYQAMAERYNFDDVVDMTVALKRAQEVAKDQNFWKGVNCGASSYALGYALKEELSKEWKIEQMWSYDILNAFKGAGHAITMLTSPRGHYYFIDVFPGYIDFVEAFPIGKDDNGVERYQTLAGEALAGEFILPVVGNLPGIFKHAEGFSFNGDLCVLKPKASVTKPISVFTSWDPNEKGGSSGTTEFKYISSEQALSYVIYCENMGTATAAAQEITVTDQLGTATVDLNTFSLGTISFGDNEVTPQTGLSDYSTEVDLRPDKNMVVRIDAGLDKNSGLVTWHFVAIDPDTNDYPEDLMLGVLAPNVTSPEGEGSVFFTVMPKAGLPTGTEIRNKASIVFDVNEAMDTNEWLNTIDNDKPSSHVLPLDAVQYTATFDVQWTGSDNGSGIKDYTLYVSTNSGSYTAWLSNETGTSTTVTGQPGSTYAFYTVARDETGNTEDAPTEPDATTHIDESVVVPTPTPSVEPTPSVIASPTTIPTPEPSPTPVIIPTPTPVTEPTVAATPTPTPTPEPSPQITPSPTPSPTEPPTAVELVIFKAKVNDDCSVTLKWKTATEVDNTGFNIYRATRKDGVYTKVNSVFIPAAGNASTGASYTFKDTPGAGTFYYKLEDIDSNGVSTMHGPVKVYIKSENTTKRRR